MRHVKSFPIMSINFFCYLFVYADINYVFVPYLPLKGAFSTLNVHNSASMVHISTFWVLYCFVFLFIIILKMSTLSFLSQNRKKNK